MKVYKYGPIRSISDNLATPVPGRIVHMQMQNNQLMVWSVDDTNDCALLIFVGTGEEFERGRCIGSVCDEGFMWHVVDLLK